MIIKKFNKTNFKREMKDECSKKDIMIKGKRVDFETSVKNYKLNELIYGDKPQNGYMEVWDNYKRYN